MAPPDAPPPPADVPGSSLDIVVNGVPRQVRCPDRTLLVDLIRDVLGLPGTHAGCLNGDCGACTVLIDVRALKSCLVLAPVINGAEITTVERLGSPGALDPVQEAFWDADGFQCGFCLPGQLFAAKELLARNADPDDAAVRAALAGNLCRCTGYQNTVEAVRLAAARTAPHPTTPEESP